MGSPDTNRRVIDDSAFVFGRHKNNPFLPPSNPNQVAFFYGIPLPKGIERVRMEYDVKEDKIIVGWKKHGRKTAGMSFAGSTDMVELATAVAVVMRMED